MEMHIFGDGSRVVVRDIGVSGQPKIEIIDTCLNTSEKLTIMHK